MKIFLMFLQVILASFAWVQAEDCIYDDHKFNAGEIYTPIGHCSKYTCQKDGTVWGVTCPSFPRQKECTVIPQDNSKPYPDCCPSPVCNFEKKN